MALSKSIQKAQNFAVCQFCEESPEIKWRCINCDLFLCQICNFRIHKKIKTSTEHEILHLKDCGTEIAIETIRKVNLETMFCAMHDGKKCFVYCNVCNQAICSSCLTQSHQKHKFSEINEVYEARMKEMKQMMDKIDCDIPFLQNEEHSLQQTFSQRDKEYQDTKGKILLQEDYLKQAVTRHAKVLLRELENGWRPTKDVVSKEIFTMRQNAEELEKSKKSLQEALISHHASDIFTVCNSVKKSLPKVSENLLRFEQTKFISGKMQNQDMSDIFGSLYRVPDLKLVYTYETNLQLVNKVLYCDNDSVFIGSYSDKVLQKVKLKNNKLKIEREMKDIAVYYMAMTQNGDLLVSTTESDLKLYSTSGELKTFRSFSPLITLGIHVNKQNEILLAVTDSVSINIPTMASVRRVMVLTSYCAIKHVFEYSTDNKRLFMWPSRVLSTKNNDVCVVDLLNDKLEGRVVAIDQWGQLKWTYIGSNNINSDMSKFFPSDMTVTSTELILISDCKNSAVHILSHNGEVITCQEVKNFGILLPFTLEVDTNGILWTGCTKYKNDKQNAKIHALSMF